MMKLSFLATHHSLQLVSCELLLVECGHRRTPNSLLSVRFIGTLSPLLHHACSESPGKLIRRYTVASNGKGEIGNILAEISEGPEVMRL